MDEIKVDINPEDSSPQDTRLDSSIVIGKEEKKGPFIRQVSNNRYENVRYSFVKAILCGKYAVITEYEKPIILDRNPTRSIPKTDDTIKTINRQRNIKRAIDTIRILGLGNFPGSVKLLTLTFNNENNFDISNIRECNKRFSIFIHLLRRLYEDFKYLAVLEFQKRGAVHYHIICDLDYMDKRKIEQFWGRGFIDIRETTSVYEGVLYLIKYLFKGLNDRRCWNNRVYFRSKNLNKPIVLYGQDVYYLRRRAAEMNIKPNYQHSFDTMENGRAFVTEYNLNYPIKRNDYDK